MSNPSQKQVVHKVGFISPPAWFDTSPIEFLRIAPKNTITLQTLIRPPDFAYSEEGFLNSVPELQICFDSLVAAGAAVVVQFGYPFSLVHGWERAQRIQQNIEGTGNTHFVMMGVEVVQALRHLDCRSIAIASTYYSGKMSNILQSFLTEAGFSVLKSENWQSQGMAEEEDSGMFIGEGELNPMDWETPIHAVQDAVRSVSRNVPDADAILVTGGGMRILDIAESLEKEIGKPVIGGDVSLYWGILRRLSVKEEVLGRGQLLAHLV